MDESEDYETTIRSLNKHIMKLEQVLQDCPINWLYEMEPAWCKKREAILKPTTIPPGVPDELLGFPTLEETNISKQPKAGDECPNNCAPMRAQLTCPVCRYTYEYDKQE